jgi:hypothetical protein
MKRKRWFVFPLLLAALVLWALLTGTGGQSGSPVGIVAARELPFDPQGVVAGDRNAYHPIEGGLRADNGRIRADLAPWGFTFSLYDDGAYRADARLGFRLVQARHGDTVLYTAPPEGGSTPSLQDVPWQAGYARAGVLVEAYLALDYQVEQFFVVPRPLSGTGDLVLTGAFSTTLMPVETGPLPAGVVRFALPGGGELTYGPAEVRDAAGRVGPVAVELTEREVRLTVPGDWLAAATYPVIVDPLYGSEIRVTTSNDAQVAPAVAANGTSGEDDDRFVVVWADDRNDSEGDGWDIYSQRVKADGTLNGSNYRVTELSDDQQTPAIAYDGGSSNPYYLLTYQDSDSNVYGWMLNKDGTRYQSEISIGTGSGTQAAPAVAYGAGAGYYLVVWEDSRDGNWNIYSRVVSPGGTPQGSETQITSHAGDETAPAVAWDETRDHYFITWQRSGDIYGIACSISSGNCSTSGHSTVTIANTGDTEANSDVAFNSFDNPDANDGELFVVWDRTTSPTSVWGQRVKWSGSDYALEGSNVRLSPAITPDQGHRKLPRVAYQPGVNEYLVTWQAGTGAIEARQVTARGAQAALYTVSGTASGSYERTLPAVVLDPTRNQYLAVWQGETICGDGGCIQTEIYGRRMDYTTFIATTTDVELYPAVAYNSDSDEYLVAWVHDSASETYIYGQRVRADGTANGSRIDICDEGNNDECGTNAARTELAVAYASNASANLRSYLIVWRDDQLDADGDIYGAEIQPDGTMVAKRFLVQNTSSDYQVAPDVTYDPTSGKYLVVWASCYNTGTNCSGAWGATIRGSIVYPRTGSPPTISPKDFLISASGSTVRNWPPGVAANPDHATKRYLVAWSHNDPTGGDAVQGAFVNPSGTPDTPFQIEPGIWTELPPAVAFGGTRFLVVSANSNGYKIIDGALLNADGTFVWGAGSDHSCQISAGQASNRVLDVDIIRISTSSNSNYFQVIFESLSGTGLLGVEVYQNSGSTCPPTPSSDEVIFLPNPAPYYYGHSSLACGAGYRCLVGRCVDDPTPTPGLTPDIYSNMIFR